MALTPRQQLILDYITDHLTVSAASPQPGEIARSCGLSPTAVSKCLEALRKKGYISDRLRHMQGGLVVRKGAGG